MRPVITPEESARLDSLASEPVEILMERAGLAVALANGQDVECALEAGFQLRVTEGKRGLVSRGPGRGRRHGQAELVVLALHVAQTADTPLRPGVAAALRASLA